MRGADPGVRILNRDVAVAEIIGIQNQDVGTLGGIRRMCRGNQYAEQCTKQKEAFHHTNSPVLLVSNRGLRGWSDPGRAQAPTQNEDAGSEQPKTQNPEPKTSTVPPTFSTPTSRFAACA